MMLLDIEKELSGSESAVSLAKHDAVLAALESRIAEAMRLGLPPDEYSHLEELREANLTARKILRISTRDGGE